LPGVFRLSVDRRSQLDTLARIVAAARDDVDRVNAPYDPDLGQAAILLTEALDILRAAGAAEPVVMHFGNGRQ
jgi:hypothetical protein